MVITEQKEKINFVRSAALPDVELLMVSDSDRHWRVLHECYTVCTGKVAAADVRYRGNLYQVDRPGTLLFEPGETHITNRVTKPQDFQVLHFAPEMIRGFSDEMGIRGEPHFKDALVNSQQLILSSTRLETAILNDAPALEQQTCLTQYLEMLLSNHLEQRATNIPDSGKQPMLRVRDYLHEHYAQSVSLDELVNASGLSRFYLIKSFAKKYGMPPHRYQIHLRIQRSLFLLRQGMALSHVASATGFTDQSHFFRHFKRVMGVTPGNYQGKKTG